MPNTTEPPGIRTADDSAGPAQAEIVYVIGAPGSTTVKIGRTVNPRKRLAEIQRMSPARLTLLWSHPGGHELETNLHRHFSGLRVHGEWFTFQADPVTMVAWAVGAQPWDLPKVNLKRPRPPRRREQRENPYVAHPSGPDELARWRRDVEASLSGLSDEIRAIQDPLQRFAAVRDLEELLGATLRGETQRAVVAMKESGLVWREIGELLGVSGQRAHQISLGGRPLYGRKKTASSKQKGRTVITRPASATSESSPR
ncbi:GIY-YIG nuclease family protein [Streptomyces sp. NBC_00338]|uniref:GIY-YIG nuclease family protein n=1 Tax=Streptomyces sp. NBC_00338 TaxID=2975715 RepID=UPI002258E6D8|nr:GIY-YIG nuclease family protein [Streptomyces sp. NBC_00338]MCX5138340.1 GIY-YIG nuclease family protein [Streptomyces sp. NBC_00338]MCX5145129.1 GIY-YIG nuclease family protein [Streptomyces sp. NBC_00338]